jgi:hypothetical protein
VATHYLYLANTVLVSLLARGARLAERREFLTTQEGLAQFEAFIAALPKIPTHLLTDIAEEDFRPDTVPHVGAGDREAVMARKLGQIFRNTPYRHGILQGRETEGRRDDRVLYVAITNPEVLRPWLDVLDRGEVSLAGIHSAALLGARLIEALDLRSRHLLLAMRTPGGMLRQTYFRDGELRVTRLIPIDPEEGQGLGDFLAQETNRTWQYLDNLRFFAPDDQLEVAVLAHPREEAEIRPHLHAFAQLAYRVLDTDEVAAAIGLKPPPAAPSAEEILVHLFRRRPIENHFATSEMRRYATLRRVRDAIATTSIVVLLAAISMGGLNFYRAMRQGEVDERIERQVRDANRAYDELARGLPTLQVGGATMRDAVAFYGAYMHDFPTVGDFLVPLSRVLEAYPGVRLTQLAWQAADDAKAVPSMPLQPPRVPPPVKALAKEDVAARSAAAGEDAANPAFAGGRYEVALVEATVSVPSHDFRGALAEVERLAADIGQVPGFSASIVESPLDVRPSFALQGRHAEREPGTMDARFVLRIVRSRGPGA